MHTDRLRWLVNERKHLTIDGAAEIAKAADAILADIERLRSALIRIADVSFEVDDALGSCIKIAQDALAENKTRGHSR